MLNPARHPLPSLRRFALLIKVFLCLSSSVSIAAAPRPGLVHHDLSVTLNPDQSVIHVRDRITLPEKTGAVRFLLHRGLTPRLATPGARITAQTDAESDLPARRWKVVFSAPAGQLELEYQGQIHHRLQTQSQTYAGGREATRGQISPQGVFLSSASYWYPVIPGSLVSFEMRTQLPAGWVSVSQGRSLENDAGWQEISPQDDIYLIAGRFQRYRQEGNSVRAEVYLRSPDQQTAERYLQATGLYLQRYSDLIGDYPYAKFALVENFWESGYGMPSFTLLGPKVIRLPFILHTSYPHEILHNWWGNGVYIDYRGGNWAEGLTAYLADHLNRELRGEGAAYRRDTLQKYADYVAREKDFPLSQFRANHGAVSQAVGYGKTLMLMHMLRHQLGDRRFIDGLRRFYRENLFRTAGFDDLRRAFEAVSGIDLGLQFEQWTRRVGAPDLRLDDIRLSAAENTYRLQATLIQLQPGAAYRLLVPVFLQLADHPTAIKRVLEMTGKKLALDFQLPARPLRIGIDLQFDLFRRLQPGEIPSAVGQLLAADQPSIVLPADAPDNIRQAYRDLARQWSARRSKIRLLWDRDLDRLPEAGPVWLFGAENRFIDYFADQLDQNQARLSKQALHFEGRAYPLGRHSLIIAAGDGPKRERPLGLLTAYSPASLASLARKLPHYGKYGYLVFEHESARNKLKGQWQSRDGVLPVDLKPEALPPPFKLPAQIPLTAP